MKIIITCEHGGNQIPQRYQNFFQDAADRLESHEGWDIGALKIANAFSDQFGDYFFYTEVSRLLVELNRSPTHPALFSSITQTLSQEVKKDLLEHYYFPYRNQVIETMQTILANGETLLHLSIHTFTPTFKGEIRNADIGLLYDPSRIREKQFCKLWRKNIEQQLPKTRVRFNYPYLGKADGFTTLLRKQIPPSDYIGIELETNQTLTQSDDSMRLIKQILLNSFDATLLELPCQL